MLTKSLLSFAAAFTMAFSLTVFSPALDQPAQAADVLKKVCENQNLSGRQNPPAVCQDKGDPNRSNDEDNPLFGPSGVLTQIINLLSVLVGVAAVIMIILGGFKLITSGSNPQDVTAAREMILYAAVGLVVVSLAQVLVRYILVKVIG